MTIDKATMMFSAADWAFFSKGKDADSYYDRLKSIGYDGVEMVDAGRWEKARGAGLTLVNMAGPGMEKGLNRREHHAELLPLLRDRIAVAGENGIPQVILFSGNRNGQTDKDGIANCRAGIEELLPDAERHHVTLVFEMLNSRDHKDYQADHGAYGFELVRQIGSPWLKLIYDVYHMAKMDDHCVFDMVDNMAAIAHVHVAGTPRRDCPRSGGAPDFSEIVHVVMKAGYGGFWGMEFIPVGDAIMELEQARACFLRWAEARR